MPVFSFVARYRLWIVKWSVQVNAFKINYSRHIWRQLVSSRRRPVHKGFADLLRSYCLGRDRSIKPFARREIFYYSAITVVLFALNCFGNAPFKCTKLNLFWNNAQLCCKSNLLVFCASMCVGNLVCAIKHFVVTFSRNDFFVLATLEALWQGRNRLWVRILNNLSPV